MYVYIRMTSFGGSEPVFERLVDALISSYERLGEGYDEVLEVDWAVHDSLRNVGIGVFPRERSRALQSTAWSRQRNVSAPQFGKRTGLQEGRACLVGRAPDTDTVEHSAVIMQ